MKRCQSRSERAGHGLSFYRLPKAVDCASSKRRALWLSRMGHDVDISDGARVCSKHFVTGMHIQIMHGVRFRLAIWFRSAI